MIPLIHNNGVRKNTTKSSKRGKILSGRRTCAWNLSKTSIAPKREKDLASISSSLRPPSSFLPSLTSFSFGYYSWWPDIAMVTSCLKKRKRKSRSTLARKLINLQPSLSVQGPKASFNLIAWRIWFLVVRVRRKSIYIYSSSSLTGFWSYFSLSNCTMESSYHGK